MRWWYTENGGRQPYPLSCLAAIAATVLCTLSILNLCVTLSLADELVHIDLTGHITNPDPGGGSSRTDKSTAIHGSGKSRTEREDRSYHKNGGQGWDDTTGVEWDERYGHMYAKLRHGRHQKSLSKSKQTGKKQTGGSDLGGVPEKGSTSLEPYCNRIEVRSFRRCVPCDMPITTMPCPPGSIPRKKGHCRLPFDGHFLPTPGCQYECQMEVTVPECCSGYWGSQCLACPGGADNECNERGECRDGIGGDGSCQCNQGFRGIACELCERDNTYGTLCDQECQCIHGTCNDGPTGDGSCLCGPGYQGHYCDEEDFVCANLLCHQNAHCELADPLTQDLTCVCNRGYDGNGWTCQEEVIHCGGTICNQHAFCSATGNCICLSGYHGDGVECIPINHCQENHGNCPVHSSFCLYDGPGESHCECRHGYEDFQPGRGCTMVDMCSDQQTPECPPHSTCFMERAGQTSCQCQAGYVSIGTGCYGNIMERLEELSSTGDAGLQGQLHTSVTVLEQAGLATLLSGHHFFTVMIPTDAAFLEADKQHIVTRIGKEPDFANYMMKLHILPTYLNSTALNATREVYTMTGLMGEITSSSKDPTTLRYRVEGSNNKGIITHMDLLASNGIIHVIDTLMYEPPTIESNTSGNVFDLISQEGRFNRLQNALQHIGLNSLIQGVGSLTFFAPYNKAFNDLPDGTVEFLFSAEGRPKLEALLRNHMIEGEMLRAQDLLNLPTNFQVTTMHNSALTIRTSANGLIYINDPSNLTITDIRTSNGIVHAIDGLLIPTDIQPLLPHKCNTQRFQVEQGICGSCEEKKSLSCSAGASPVHERAVTMGCVYEVFTGGVILPEIGCSLLCNRTILIEECCAGFYGESCLPCPGGFQTPCNNHGQCNDGSDGTGDCVCDTDFMGTACELCSRQDHYGDACDQECECVYGVCDSGPQGSGQCNPNSCTVGFSGVNCDQHVNLCGPQGDPCHAQAVCHDDGHEIRCICNAGYEGDGLACTPVNVCEQPARGNCHQEAHCTYLGPGAHNCNCNEFWEGDGYECVPVDPCTKVNRGDCHSNATCIYTSPGANNCKCKTGYSGTGQYCEPINQCTMGNGGCHPQAECEYMGPGVVTCRCREGYQGDGQVCYSNVAVELSTLQITNQFYALIQRAGLERSLASSSGVTVFIPRNTAFDSLSEQDEDLLMNGDDDFVASIIKKHFVSNVYLKQDLFEIAESRESWLPTWLDTFQLLIATCGQNICIDQTRVRVELTDIIASNGVIHIIDRIVFLEGLPEEDDYSVSSFMRLPGPALSPGSPLPQALEAYDNYHNFTHILEEHGFLEMLNGVEAYTLFAPGNGAVASWNPSRMDTNLLKFHIVIGQRLETSDLQDGLHVNSMLGHNFQLRFHLDEFQNNPHFHVNNIPIVNPDIPTDKGVVHGLMDVLNPIPNRCDFNRTSYIPSPCLACNFVPDCPVGSTALDQPKESNCQYTEELYGRIYHRQGCTVQCVMVQYFPQCCSGFYGSECEECPGGWVDPCYGHGTCKDGVNGTGECQCQDGFQGTACEQCEEGKYGPSCDQECQCAHGLCRDGMEGDGRCRCNRGWTGEHCNSTYSIDQMCDPECDPNAYCVDGRCVCYSGYTGDGLACAEFDVCDTDPCSTVARCESLGQGRYSCQCDIGYEGDGFICREVNPCEIGQSGCHRYADCYHTGPALSVCVCLPGYEGDGRIHCQSINPCLTDNGGCDIRAICNHTGPNERECQCFEGHVGDGFICTGNLLEELAMIPDVSRFRGLLENDTRLRQLLAMPGPFTLFVPTNEAMERISQQQMNTWQANEELIRILLYHMISCEAVDSDALLTKSSWVTLVGQSVTVTQSQDDDLILNGATHVVHHDLRSTNGVMHLVDRLLVPSLTSRSPNEEIPTFEELARNGSYHLFLELMQQTGVFSEFNNPLSVPATLFVPSDAAFDLLAPERLTQLQDANDQMVLLEFVKYHFVPSKMLHVPDFAASPGGQRFTTLQGSQITIGCKPDQGGIFINEESRIVVFEQHFQEGLFFGIDRVLVPPSIGGRCDERSVRTTMTECSSCSAEFVCPRGFVRKGAPISDCHYMIGWFIRKAGCRQECVLLEIIPKCCDNYYGSDCRECPGGPRTPCSSHGVCWDGHDSDGHCECDPGFTGTACELCTAGRYGLSCMECQCGEHGICQDGRHGSGSCFCHSGWTGPFCDSALRETPTCDRPCHQNAVCRERNQCECYPQYYGDGYDCSVVNQCAFNNGGCSPYAYCTQSSSNVTCRCQANYEGDGVVCRPVDKCQVHNGGCHPSAICTMTGPNTRSCQCRPPHEGDGISCKPPHGKIPQCSIDNGGCSENAYCIDSHVMTSTPRTGPIHEPPTDFVPPGGQIPPQFPGPDFNGRQYGNLPAPKRPIPYRPKRRKRDDRLPTYMPEGPSRAIHCICKDGYIGNGTLCNGNMLETLASIPAFSEFYQAVIQYVQQNHTSDSKLLLDTLQSLHSSLTLFVPMGEEFSNHTKQVIDFETVPKYFVEMMKISRDDFYDNMTLTTWRGKEVLKVEQIQTTRSQALFTLNGVNITYYDIPTTNGIIHTLQQPLTFLGEEFSITMKKKHPPSRIVAFISLASVSVIILCIVAIVIIQYRAHRRRPAPDDNMVSYAVNLDDGNDGTVTFSHIKGEDGGDETDMTDTDDGGACGMDSPEYVLGDTLDDTVAFANLDFTGASEV